MSSICWRHLLCMRSINSTGSLVRSSPHPANITRWIPDWSIHIPAQPTTIPSSLKIWYFRSWNASNGSQFISVQRHRTKRLTLSCSIGMEVWRKIKWRKPCMTIITNEKKYNEVHLIIQNRSYQFKQHLTETSPAIAAAFWFGWKWLRIKPAPSAMGATTNRTIAAISPISAEKPFSDNFMVKPNSIKAPTKIEIQPPINFFIPHFLKWTKMKAVKTLHLRSLQPLLNRQYRK